MLVLVLFALHSVLYTEGQQCASRNYGNGGTVCVCNITYCDIISRPQPVPPTEFLVFTSNKAGLRLQQTNGTFGGISSLNEVYADSSEEIFDWDPNSNEIFIDSTTQFQSINGWGGAFTDATGININSLPERLQETLLNSLFSENGIEYSLGRVPIGGTDFSTHAYSYDDGAEDPLLLNFRLAPEDFRYKIPIIQKALNLTNGNLQLLCSAWTAPKWMKTNNAYSGFGYIRRSMYQTWAEYYVKFLDAYQEQNITFFGMTTGNEPADVLNPFDVLEVVGWPSWLIGEWIANNLGPTIRSSNHSDIAIMILDDQRIFLPWYIERAFRGNNAREYINGIAVHWYLDEYITPAVLSRTQHQFPDMFLLATEASVMPEGGESAVLLGSWRRGEKYSSDIIQDIQHWVTGWIDWNMVLDLQGGPNYINNFVDAVIIVNATNNEFYKQPLYYHFAHFTKFVPRGSVRVHSSGQGGKHLNVVAFQRPDNGTAVVLLNTSERTVPVNVTDISRGTASLELSPRSITTVLYW